MKSFKNGVFFVLLSFMVLAMMVGGVSSCQTQKHITTETENIDSITIEKQKVLLTQKDQRITYLENRVAQLEYLGITFNPVNCPEFNVDSFRLVLEANGCKQSTVDSLVNRINDYNKRLKDSQAEVTRLANGDLKIKGSLKEVTQSSLKIQEELKAEKINSEKKDSTIKELQSQLSVEKSKKNKEIERSYIPFWIWLVVAGSILFGLWSKGVFKFKKQVQV